jgi:hypothetical protein
MTARTLLPQHQALVDASSISPEVAEARGYWSATSTAELEALGFRPYQCSVPALVVPIRDTTGRVVLHQIRPDRPRTTEAGRELKYETPAGATPVLDVHPNIVDALGDPKTPLWATEGSRKVDAAVSRGLVCIGLLGVDAWRGTNESGGKVALPDWEHIALNEREVFIAFDSDVMTKESVSMACARLKRFLKHRGARVRLVYLPNGEGDGKVGLDDYFAAGHTVDDLLGCVERPRTDDDERGSKKESRADREVRQLVDITLSGADATGCLFHTPGGEPFVVIEREGIAQTLPIRSTAFRNYLAAEFFAANQQAPSGESLRQTRYVLEGKAAFEGPEVEVYTRVAPGPDGASIYVDLADSKWRAVRIDSAGWGIVSKPPVRFRRAAGMLALPRPERGGSVETLRSFVNVATDDDFALLVGWLVAGLRDRGPYPVLVMQGEQGSAKSTSSRVCRRILDPNKADMRSQPKEPRDLAIAANNSWVISLDNLSGVPDWLSDGLCRMSTGGGFATRTLYSDSDETILDSTRPILLNGIDSIATRGDLLDRAIVLNLPRLHDVREEKNLWRDFEVSRPQILGALLDAVSLAIRNEEHTKLNTRVRMADAARWVVAAEPALPWEAGTFLDAYADNRADANAIVLEGSPVAAALRTFLAKRQEFQGTATELLKLLEAEAGEKTVKLKAWPSTPRALGGQIRRLAPNLRAAGIDVDFGQVGHQKTRVIAVSLSEGTDRPHRPHGPQPCDSEDLGADGMRTQTSDPDDLRPRDRPQANPRNGSEKDDADDADAKIATPEDTEEGWL